MARVLYDDEGPFLIEAVMEALRDPGIPMEIEASLVTGISDADLVGRSIDPDEVRAFMAGCDLVIAHNAQFDRRKVERDVPGCGFDELPWICSFDHVDWLSRGSGRSLFEIVTRCGYHYGAHDAMADVRGLAFALASRGPNGVTALSEARDNGLRKRAILVAENSPFDNKDVLNAAGFRWDGEGDVTGSRNWFLRTDAESLLDPALADQVRRAYADRRGVTRDVALPMVVVDASSAFSSREKLTADNRVMWSSDPDSRTDLARLMGVPIPSSEPSLIRSGL